MIIGNIISFFYIFGTLPLAQFLFKDRELQRKFVHIVLCFWWFLCIALFNDWKAAAFCPFLFTIINYTVLSGKIPLKSLSSLIREGEKPIGTMVFPISLLVLVLFSYVIIKNPVIGGIGFVILGVGDAAAALVGIKHPYLPYKVFNNTKTVSGSIAMLITSFVSLIPFLVFVLKKPLWVATVDAIVLSIVGTLCEALTPFGIDNLTIPLLTVLVYYYFLC